jgi:tripartite-type tricarboxylate transporter receptor subunit TctC
MFALLRGGSGKIDTSSAVGDRGVGKPAVIHARVLRCGETMSTRPIPHLAAFAAALLFGASACAQSPDYPSKPIRLVVGFPPGSATDVASRIIAGKMSELLGQPVIVDNRPGASTGIAALAVAKSAPDGYTLFMAGNSNAVTPSLQKNLPFDFFRDFSPIALAVTVPSIVVVNPAFGASGMAQLIEAARNNPGKVFYASSGNGTMSHLAGELLAHSTGTRMTHVPYKGSAQAVTDLLSGNVSLMFAPASSVLQYVKDGRLKALATTGAERSRIAPELPTIAEAGVKDYDTRIWFGLAAPAGTPQAVIGKLAGAVERTLDAPDVVRLLAAQGIEPLRGDARHFSEHMRRETQKWSALIQSRGIAAD